MSAEPDRSVYLDLFLQEAREQLEVLEHETLLLEKEPTTDRLQTIFRAAHTIKGSSRAMGFAHVAELTHEMENVLDQLRNGTLDHITEVDDVLLACADTLGRMIESISAGGSDDEEVGFLVARLRKFGRSEVGSQIGPEHFSAMAAVAALTKVYTAKFQINPGCVMKYVRAFMAFTLIQEKGEIIASAPDMEALEEEKFDLTFEFAFTYEGDLKELEPRLRALSEIDEISFAEWKAPTVENAAEEALHAESKSTPKVKGQTVRVDVSRLDSLMNLVGELVIDRSRIALLASEFAKDHRGDMRVGALLEAIEHVARITTDLQYQILQTRMMPIDTVLNRFPRVVRDLAQKLGKEVDLEIKGADTELDRSVVEVIGDPILHMLRNCVDHGLETVAERAAAGKLQPARITLTAGHRENSIVIEIADNGRGINTEKLRAKAVEVGLMTRAQADALTEKEAQHLIFRNGFTTASAVSELSGRGVGMDIIRANIIKLSGSIEMESTQGKGTKFTLRLPLTLAIIRGLIVRINNQAFVLPLSCVIETLKLDKDKVKRANHRDVLILRNQTVPLLKMNQFFGMKEVPSNEKSFVVVVGLADQKIGLVVDTFVSEQEVVLKSLSPLCGATRGISGATILGDGNVALIVDVNSVVESANN